MRTESAFLYGFLCLSIAISTGCPSTSPKQPPTARFQASPTQGIGFLKVACKDKSLSGSAPIVSWHWNFGDGSNSELQNPEHSYAQPGVYSLSLTVTTSAGQDTALIQDYILVEDVFGEVEPVQTTPKLAEDLTLNDGKHVFAAPDQLLIALKPDITPEELNAIVLAIAAESCQIVGYATGSRVLQIQLSEGASILQLIEKWREFPAVLDVFPNVVVSTSSLTAYGDNFVDRALAESYSTIKVDPRLLTLHPRTTVTPLPSGFDGDYWIDVIHAESAWGISTGSEAVLLGIVDKGIDPDGLVTPDRLSRYYSNGASGSEVDAHGTFVTGIAAGNGGDETQDAVGVAWKNPILFVCWTKNFLGLTYGMDSIGAIELAINKGARVINCSFGYSLSQEDLGTEANYEEVNRSFRENMTSVIEFARRENVLVCFASGNCGEGLDPHHYPAIEGSGDASLSSKGIPNFVEGTTVHNDDDLLPPDTKASRHSWDTNALIVGACASEVYSETSPLFADVFFRDVDSTEYTLRNTALGKVADFSVLGDVVSLVAPGLRVGHGNLTGDGTSYAAPLVSGTAALIMSVNPQLAAPEVRRILLDSANSDPFEGLSAKVGAGVLDADRSLEFAASTVSVPSFTPPGVVLAKDDTHSIEVEVTVPMQTVHAVDLVILTDVTGSYLDDIATLKFRAEEIISGIVARFDDVQFGVASFSDFPFSPYGYEPAGDRAYYLNQKITGETAHVFAAIDSLYTHSGGDSPESQLEALYQLATGMGRDLNGDGDFMGRGEIPPSSVGWRPGALRMVVIATDAAFHDSDDEPGYPGASYAATVASLREQGITLLGLYTGSSAQADMIPLVEATGGAAFPLASDSSNILDAIQAALDTSLSEVKLSFVPLNDPEGFIQHPSDLVLEGVHPGQTVTFSVDVKGVLNRSIWNLDFEILNWVLVNDTGLILRVPMHVTVPGWLPFKEGISGTRGTYSGGATNMN